jgi:hypothetical protein
MVEEAQRLAAAGGSPTTEAYVAAAASEIHACDGDEPASRRSIERGEEPSPGSRSTRVGSGENLRRIRTLYAEDLRVHWDHPDVRALGDRLASCDAARHCPGERPRGAAPPLDARRRALLRIAPRW